MITRKGENDLVFIKTARKVGLVEWKVSVREVGEEMSNQMERLQNDSVGHNRSNEHRDREDHRSNREGSREKEYHSSSREGHHSSRWLQAYFPHHLCYLIVSFMPPFLCQPCLAMQCFVWNLYKGRKIWQNFAKHFNLINFCSNRDGHHSSSSNRKG